MCKEKQNEHLVEVIEGKEKREDGASGWEVHDENKWAHQWEKKDKRSQKW